MNVPLWDLKKKDYNIIFKATERGFLAHKTILTVRRSVFESLSRKEMKEKATDIIHIVDCEPSPFSSCRYFL